MFLITNPLRICQMENLLNLVRHHLVPLKTIIYSFHSSICCWLDEWVHILFLFCCLRLTNLNFFLVIFQVNNNFLSVGNANKEITVILHTFAGLISTKKIYHTFYLFFISFCFRMNSNLLHKPELCFYSFYSKIIHHKTWWQTPI